MKTKWLRTLTVIAGIGVVAVSSHAQQLELKCNAGPLSVSSGGSVGISGVGLSASYNPWSKELCSGVGTGGGFGPYGEASAQLCGTPDGRRQIKSGAGFGYGVGLDGLRVGCAMVGYGSRQLPPLQPRPMPLPLPSQYRPVTVPDYHATR